MADRELRRIVLSSILPRLPAGINAMCLTLLVQSLYQSFVAAGAVSAAYLVALGFASPLLGRFVDQRGPRLLMMPLALVHALSMVAMVLAAWQQMSVVVLQVLAFIAGLSFPPVSMTVRAMWRKANLPDQTKQLGFAMESVIMESVFVCGPLIVSFFLLFRAPAGALLFSAVATCLGTVWFTRSGALERWGRVEQVQRHWLGPLKHWAVRRALVVPLLLGATFGLQEFGLIAAARAAAADVALGFLFAAYSLPSVLAGLLYGTRQFAWPLNRQMASCHVWIALCSLVLAHQVSLPLIALVGALCGLAVGPAITASQMQLGKLTPVEYSTEAFTWSMTLFMLGLGGAFACGGWLTDRWGVGAAMLAAGTCAALCALMCLRVPEVYALPEEPVR